MTNNFYYNLSYLRKINQLDQKDIARLVGKSVSTVSAWEKATRQPLVEDVWVLSKYFGVDMETLYMGDVSNVERVR